jgi:hypothetical protein
MISFKDPSTKFDRLMAAITFAEAGERESALEFLYTETRKKTYKSNEPKIKIREKIRSDLRT